MKVYSGPRGSGKTAHAVKDALEKLSYRKHNNVVANFDMNFRKSEIGGRKSYDKKFFFIPDHEMLTPEVLIELSAKNGWYEIEGQTLLILDESGIKFNARKWNISPQIALEWVDFFVNSRKLGYDPVLIAQNRRMIDRQIRDIIETDVKHAKLNNLHLFKYVPIPIFVTITKWLIGDFKPQVKFHLLNPFQKFRYNTMKLFDPKIIAIVEKFRVDLAPISDEGVRGPTDGMGARFKRFFTPKPLEGSSNVEE
jgi:hypothetical protein